MDVCFSFIALKLAFRSITCPPVSHAFGPTFPAWLWHSPDVPTLPEPAPSSTSVMGFLHFPQNTSKHMLFLLMDWLVSDNWGWKNSHSHEWMKKLPNRPIMISCCFLTAASHFKILFWLVHCVPPPKKNQLLSGNTMDWQGPARQRWLPYGPTLPTCIPLTIQSKSYLWYNKKDIQQNVKRFQYGSVPL